MRLAAALLCLAAAAQSPPELARPGLDPPLSRLEPRVREQVESALLQRDYTSAERLLASVLGDFSSGDCSARGIDDGAADLGVD